MSDPPATLRRCIFMKLGRDLLPLIGGYLDVFCIRQWFEVLALNRAMVSLMSDSGDWLDHVYVPPRHDLFPPPPLKLLSVVRWYVARACNRARVIHLHEVEDVGVLELVLRSRCVAFGKMEVLKVGCSFAGRSGHRFAALSELLVEVLASGIFSNLVHFELQVYPPNFTRLSSDGVSSPHSNPVTADGDDDDAEFPGPHSAHTLYLAIQKHCPMLKRLEGAATWPGFGSLCDIVGPRNNDFQWKQLTHISFFDLLPTAWVEQHDSALWGGGIGYGAGEMHNSEILDEVFDNTPAEEGVPPHHSSRAALQRCFRPFSRKIFPALFSLELRFNDVQDLQRFFALWHHYVFPDFGKSSELPEVCCAQITSLQIYIDSINPTQHFEQQIFWNKFRRDIDRRGLKDGAALLPRLEQLTIDSWLPSSHFIRILLGTNRKKLRLLSLCPGDEDPATVAFLEHHWNSDNLGIEHLLLRRRKLTPRGTLFSRYLIDERTLHSSYLNGYLTRADYWSSEYEADDAFAVRGADYGITRNGVSRGLCSALRESKMRTTRVLGISNDLLDLMGCTEPGGRALQRVRREQRVLFDRAQNPMMEKLVIYFRHQGRVFPGRKAEQNPSDYSRCCVQSVLQFVDAWAHELENDRVAGLASGRSGGVGDDHDDDDDDDDSPAPSLCPLREIRIDFPKALSDYSPHFHLFNDQQLGPSGGMYKYFLSDNYNPGESPLVGKDKSLLRLTLVGFPGAKSLFLCRE